tara:strand:- start:18032 stop:18766 length:735 start_codon:yes stop_codon:yes gene_type:complete
MSRILIIGESCTDVFHYGHCSRLCPEAPVPVFNSRDVIKNGGMALNTYNNILALGGQANILTNENWETITKTRFVDKRANHMFMRLDENDDAYGKCDLSTIDLSSYDFVVVSDYDKGYLSEGDLYEISKLSKASIIDTKKILGSWVEEFDFIKINNSEFEKTKHTINDKIKQKLIITQGPSGCTFRGVKFPVKLVEVKDTSGAGDTFVAAFSNKYADTNNVNESIEFANKCATIVVQKMGVASL